MEKQQLIILDKIDPNQLPELADFKERGVSLLKECSFIKIEDNSSYEIAKKHRTALKTYRTDVQKSEKAIKDKINSFKTKVQNLSFELIGITQTAENKQQSEIDVWEEKKEQERQEKARLEEQRIDGIKKRIGAFRQNWEDLISQLWYDGIHDCENNFKNMVEDFDRVSLQEFEVLFDDAVSYLTNLLNSRISTLTEQEQIRINNLVIEEKNSENRKIQSWQNTWNTNISSLVFDDITDVKKSFRQSKLEFLKHYTTEYDEIYSSTEKRLHSQIEFISKAEEQRIAKEKFDKEQAEIAEKNRIAQEKFLKEKQEFEEKQANAKFQERKNIVSDEGYWDLFMIAECGEEEDVAKAKLLAYSDEQFEDFVKAIIEARTPKEEESEREFQEEPISIGVYVGPSEVVSNIYNPADVSDTEVVFEDVSQKSNFEKAIENTADSNFKPVLYSCLAHTENGKIVINFEFEKSNFDLIKDITIANLLKNSESLFKD